MRQEHPGCGVEKMYYSLKPAFIGRDKFIEIFMGIGFRLKRPKNYRRTTYSVKNTYPNIIKGLLVKAPGVIWQSDITYIDAGGLCYYGVFIIDVYTKKIVGYNIGNHMRATANIAALQMALKAHPPPSIHHSDRGSQYNYKEYIEMLEGVGCKISMALTAQDNAYAERINQTIKAEYLDYWKPKSFEALKKYVHKAVYNYNHHRPHNHLRKMTPIEFEEKWAAGKIKPKIEITIFDNGEK